ncbi:hypothetical protein Glove_169g47 [Diversispora epigaea]|uniref:Protein kinase domain-containing protein n=1 Tax=Diversispora epigaea TaxID=1348612 RepID=A0A397IU61_9GLOM|nr:hypothetical protein Glove_169g47 [Diversispora epigaea]
MMSQEKTNDHEAIKGWDTWMNNLIIDETIRKENISFYQYSEFKNVELIDGNVYKATFKPIQKMVTLKYVTLTDYFTLENLINEIKRHQKLENHDSILKFYGITKQECTNKYMLILEYSNNGSLRQYLKKNFQQMDWNVKLNLARQISNVLMHLHSNDVIHGKLNTENILVHNGNIKLNDFCIAKCMLKSLGFLTNTFGPIQYMDPQHLELFNTIGNNKSSDIFSLGVILWEISSGNAPFEIESLDDDDLINDIMRGKREMVIPDTPSKYKEIYTDCWKHNGNSRPDIFQVVKNLSEVNILDANVEFESSQLRTYNDDDYYKLEKINMQNNNKRLEIQFDSFVDGTTEVNVFINDLFEFFIDLLKKQNPKIRPIMIKKYIRECNKHPVKVLYEMINHQSYYWFTSLIGFFYMYGVGTVNDNKMAYKFFSLAANQVIDIKNASPNSLLLQKKLHNINKEIGSIYLVTMYLKGMGVRKDMKKAFRICSNVADEGSVVALNYLALIYENGFGVEKNDEKAFELYLRSAEQGSLVAQNNIGLCFRYGTGISKDVNKGFQWSKTSALAGNVDAMTSIGYCYFEGIGVDEDKIEAFEWYLKAAKKGHPIAQCNLGYCYTNGEGIDKDQVRAFEWFKKAAENDNIDGQCMVGYCFYLGHGTKKDIVKSIYCIDLFYINKGYFYKLNTLFLVYEVIESRDNVICVQRCDNER